MTDRELLELAAKANGEKCDQLGENAFGLHKPKEGYMQPYIEWNPLTDDGDALRLAVRLDLIVSRGYTEVGKEAVVFYLNEIQHQMRCVVPHGSDPYAATRRAITRAAAEIGKGMP